MMYSENYGAYGIIKKNCDSTPDKEAIIIEGDRATFHSLVSSAEYIASGLCELGIRQGDRVGILLPNSMNWVHSFCGILRLGAVPMPFDPQLGEYEMKVLFNHVGLRALVLTPQYRGVDHLSAVRKLRPLLPDLREIIVDGECVEDHCQLPFSTLLFTDTSVLEKVRVQVNPEDTNLLVCTTGSTGMPKVVDFSYAYTETVYRERAEFYRFDSDDIFLIGMPLYHAAGFNSGFTCLAAGGKVLYKEEFSPVDYLQTIATEKVTKVKLTPTLAKILLSTPNLGQYDLSSLQDCIFAGEYLSDDLAYRFRDELHVRVTNNLGMTEVGPYLTWDSVRDSGVSPSYFSPPPGYEIKILNRAGERCKVSEAGTMWVRGPMMKGYYQSEELTREIIDEDGWLNTGDMGCLCTDGRIALRGRKKRIIKRGANLVYPEEVETFLRTHPDIVAVAVVGEAIEIYGEKIVAYIQPKSDAKMTAGDLLDYCRGQISAYKIPDEFRIVSEIPIRVGKVVAGALRPSNEKDVLYSVKTEF